LIISVASGKGGTGKTTIATNMAAVLARRGFDVTYLDADVEEPNGKIFLKPDHLKQFDVSVPVPRVDFNKCTFCGACSTACEFHAIAVFGKTVVVFDSLCHSCGGCSDICPENAITEISRNIGFINQGIGLGVKFYEGRLNVGEAVSPPVTKTLRKISEKSPITIIDAPPGTSCPVIEAINNTDFVVLVTEPTPFGLNDLKLAVAMVRELQLPVGVVLNRCDIGDNLTEDYCNKEKIDILLKMPYNRKLAESYSHGDMIFNLDPAYDQMLFELYNNITGRIHHDRISCR